MHDLEMELIALTEQQTTIAKDAIESDLGLSIAMADLISRQLSKAEQYASDGLLAATAGSLRDIEAEIERLKIVAAGINAKLEWAQKLPSSLGAFAE